MPEGTLTARADHGDLGGTLPADGGDCEDVLARFARAGIDIDALAARLQDEGARSFVKSWNELMAVIGGERAPPPKGGRYEPRNGSAPSPPTESRPPPSPPPPCGRPPTPPARC